MKNETAGMNGRDLPSWITQLLRDVPAAGTGVHAWLYRAACALKPWRSPADSVAILTAAVSTCGRRIPPREITEAVNHARNDWTPDGLPRGLREMVTPSRPVAKWPAPDWNLIQDRADFHCGSPDKLLNYSPVSPDCAAEEYLQILFPGDPLLCIAAAHPADARTRALSTWLSMEDHISSSGLIVPSPMTAPTGRRLDDREVSHRCLDNTGPRRWLVVEFDFRADRPGEPETPQGQLVAEYGTIGLCASMLLHLRDERFPLALVVHSGGKSLHGWFPCEGRTDDKLKPFFDRACKLGADPATWNRCQLVRLPAGRRDNGKPQPVLYINPDFAFRL